MMALFQKMYSGENFLPIDDLNVAGEKITAQFTPGYGPLYKIKSPAVW